MKLIYPYNIRKSIGTFTLTVNNRTRGYILDGVAVSMINFRWCGLNIFLMTERANLDKYLEYVRT